MMLSSSAWDGLSGHDSTRLDARCSKLDVNQDEALTDVFGVATCIDGQEDAIASF
jgi:hypothetical protein